MRKVLLGHVGVDSGQLMVADPCYINSQWKQNGSVIGVKLWGQAHKEIYSFLKDKYPELEISQRDHVIYVKTTDVELAKNIYAEGSQYAHIIGKVIVGNLETNSTYDRICHVTQNEENQGGSIPYVMGHEGFAVAFSSGLGDGFYPVYATIEDVPGWGERITKVEIELVNMDEVEEDENE